jgi:sn-glycerol 3-phosphate transport system substrate-binding protein
MRLLASTALALSLLTGAAHAATDIDFFFPVAVQGKLSNEVERLVADFNRSHPDIHVTAAYTGDYSATNLKTHAAIQAGHAPAVVLMSANFIREYAITQSAIPLDGLIAKDGQTNAQFMDEFFPAVRENAMEAGHVYGAPFQNSTPILYYNTDMFKAAGLDPNKPPLTWQEWVDDAKKLTVMDGKNFKQSGVTIISMYDTLGWLVSGFAMQNGGDYYNHGWGGEVYYNTPSTIGAVTFLDDLVHTFHVMPEGVIDANAASNAFFSGRTAMLVNSTGALGFMRDNMKLPFKVAFLPMQLRHAAPIGGASLLIPAGNTPERQAAAWTFIKYLTSPEIDGGWSRFTGYFAPRMAAYDLPEMKAYLAKYPDAKVAVDQLAYATPWFATFNTVGVRKALEDQVQAVLSGKIKPAAAMALAQKNADALLRPYVEQTALNLPK